MADATVGLSKSEPTAMATENIRFMKLSYLGAFVEVVDLQQRLL
jgi:hypothetical protein